MYAIVKTGGKQFKAAKDEVLQVEKLKASRARRLNSTKF